MTPVEATGFKIAEPELETDPVATGKLEISLNPDVALSLHPPIHKAATLTLTIPKYNFIKTPPHRILSKFK
jgi:hypothetical protein